MFVSLTIVRYPKYFIPFAFLSMAILHLPLFFTRGLSFWKLLGCGKNGTFDIQPDFQQWGMLGVWNQQSDFEKFQENSWVSKWWRFFCHEKWTIGCIPYESHGKWDKKEPFGKPIPDRNYSGPIAVLTRATISWSKLKSFWSNVPIVSASMNQAQGFITSVGIGEVPFIRQATFSVWDSLDDVKQFAYKQREHAQIVKKTHNEKWYSEELFARFIPIFSTGTIKGVNPIII
ncbi:spheroidene monooxygenase [Emticicia oligotrophica DSM 17448]|uniref:Spheroidene monooxygenase n=1 Tax=Emticicia oligotrophica (strain DSM 17448 / CIP 109782 / MTCC 6937 / GPTSA100-15) TaxID=929562 RepID=A0ABM5N3N8_EMTOG|nr:DUF3291 domain-containing protein [Emticicia oligotrophica]AFK04098.1 spheroidene monooxygenase [Emticicia oligotrophica DSM 17448]